jgi:phytanoyl-CoA hydroxylase
MANFKEGDVVFHNPFIIHGACVNTTDRVMIHTDTRYVNPADGFDKRWTVFWDRECIIRILVILVADLDTS